ncbi:MAG: matrixin family metalloprotease [Proteobacteria bacterium]|nr:MAG: matrixin family metalloprotease [Pseudomonadota bacterium]
MLWRFALLKTALLLSLSLSFVACGSGSDKSSGDNSPAVESSEYPMLLKPLTIYYSDRIQNAAMIEALPRAMDAWNKLIGREVLINGGSASISSPTSLYSTLGDTKSSLIFLEDWTNQTSDSGVSKHINTASTSIFNTEANGNIGECDTLINTNTYTYEDVPAGNPGPNDPSYVLPTRDDKVIIDAQSILMHELGHCLGLNHTDSKSNRISDNVIDVRIMNQYTPFGYKRVEFTEGDKSAVDVLYNNKK